MQPLSGMDNLFLQLEKGNQRMHVAGLGIYDQSTAPGGSVRFKQILDFFGKRLNKSKLFRRRLVVPPLGIDRPYWIDEPEIDVEYHVRHIALPHPGDWRQLMIQIARIHARPLDRSKPMWEVYVIEGLDNIPGIAKGSFAMYTKFHHALVDGEAGAQVIGKIHSLSPEPDEDDGTPHVIMADREPTTIELYSRAVINRGKQLFDAGKLIASLGSRIGKAGVELATSGKLADVGQNLFEKATEVVSGLGKEGLSARAQGAGFAAKPHTRFDGTLSPHRVVDAVPFSLADCKAIREHLEDVTINDIFLAACGGAVRRYLQAKGELPAQSLTALMPISTRGEAKGTDTGNQVGMIPVPLRSDIADPVERLRGTHRGASASKGASSMLGHDFAGKVIQVLPATVAEAVINHGLVPMCNTTVSNVRGPAVPLYMAGARLQVFLPVSIPLNGIGLNMTGFSYNGILWVCFVSCRNMLPDPQFFRQCLNESFAEIVAAAKAHPLAAEQPVKKSPAEKKAASAPKKAAAPRKAATPKAAAKTPEVKKAAAPAKARKVAKPKA